MGKPIRWGNVTVPYTAMWTAEAETRRPSTRLESWGGRRFAMLCEGVNAPGGKPLFKILHSDRCREVVRGRLCQMCVRPLPREVVGFNQGQVDGLNPLLSDGLPMCWGCALEAFRSCPGLVRQAEAGVLRIWATVVGAWSVAPVLMRMVAPEEGGDARVNDLVLRQGPYGLWTGPKLVLSAFRRIELAELEQNPTISLHPRTRA